MLRFTNCGLLGALAFRERQAVSPRVTATISQFRRAYHFHFSRQTGAPLSHSHFLPYRIQSNHHLFSHPSKHSHTPCVLISPRSSPSGSASAPSSTPPRRSPASIPRMRASLTLSGREWRTSWGLSAVRHSSTRGELNCITSVTQTSCKLVAVRVAGSLA